LKAYKEGIDWANQVAKENALREQMKKNMKEGKQ